MKKFLFFLVIVGGTLAVFNPDDTDFAAHVNEKSQTVVSDQARSSSGGLYNNTSGSSTNALSHTFSNVGFERQNYFIFSMYRANIHGDNRTGGKWSFLGIGGQFFEMQKPWAYSS